MLLSWYTLKKKKTRYEFRNRIDGNRVSSHEVGTCNLYVVWEKNLSLEIFLRLINQNTTRSWLRHRSWALVRVFSNQAQTISQINTNNQTQFTKHSEFIRDGSKNLFDALNLIDREPDDLWQEIRNIINDEMERNILCIYNHNLRVISSVFGIAAVEERPFILSITSATSSTLFSIVRSRKFIN